MGDCGFAAATTWKFPDRYVLMVLWGFREDQSFGTGDDYLRQLGSSLKILVKGVKTRNREGSAGDTLG